MPSLLRTGWPWLAALVVAGACGGSSPSVGTEHSYTVTAEIVRLPKPDAPRRDLVLAHEAIPEFVDIRGENTGMEAMTMPFPLAQGLDLGSLQPGDHVRATFVVRFQGSPPYQVTHLEKISDSP